MLDLARSVNQVVQVEPVQLSTRDEVRELEHPARVGRHHQRVLMQVLAEHASSPSSRQSTGSTALICAAPSSADTTFQDAMSYGTSCLSAVSRVERKRSTSSIEPSARSTARTVRRSLALSRSISVPARLYAELRIARASYKTRLRPSCSEEDGGIGASIWRSRMSWLDGRMTPASSVIEACRRTLPMRDSNPRHADDDSGAVTDDLNGEGSDSPRAGLVKPG